MRQIYITALVITYSGGISKYLAHLLRRPSQTSRDPIYKRTSSLMALRGDINSETETRGRVDGKDI